jgi:sialate O-acetylesterase
MPSIFSSGMVIQAQKPVTIHGSVVDIESSDTRPVVSVAFRGKTYTTALDDAGAWRVTLDPAPSGGPYALRIECGGESRTIDDVYSGDVFLCAGQSNMELQMARLKDDYPEEWTREAYPVIRELRFPYAVRFDAPQDDTAQASWKQASKETLDDFSGAAYFFAKKWYETRHTPTGIIIAAVGGAPIECFMSKETLRAVHSRGAALASCADTLADSAYADALIANHAKETGEWDDAVSVRRDPYVQDKNFLVGDFGKRTESGTIELPGQFAEKAADFKDFQGVAYMTRNFVVSAADAGKKANLWLGTIVDSDTTFINGQNVGETGYRYPPRKYVIPEGLLREGENTIVVRVVCNNGLGEVTADKPFAVFFGAASGSAKASLPVDSIDLSGEWRYTITARTDARPKNFFIHWQPSGLYNALVAPVLRLPLRAVLWYQGESNANTFEDAREYKTLLQAMINEWRERAGAPDLPFVIAGLPVFGAAGDPLRLIWAELRTSQEAAVFALHHTALAACYDTGEWNDLHPVNKKAVGERLYNAAQSVV